MTDTNHYHDINRTTIGLIVKFFRDGNYKELCRLGISPDLAKRLYHMQMDCFSALSSFRGAIIDFHSNNELIRLLIDRLEQESHRDTQIKELIRLGASQPMLEELEGIDRSEYQRHSRMIELSSSKDSVVCSTGPGRPRNLSTDEAQRVSNFIQVLNDSGTKDPLERYLLLGQKTGIPLNFIWTYLRESGIALDEIEAGG